MRFFLLSFLFIIPSSLKAQDKFDADIFLEDWVILTDQAYFKENTLTTADSTKVKQLRKAIYDTDSSFFGLAIFTYFETITNEEIKKDNGYDQIIIIDMNKDGNNDLVYYSNPNDDVYLSVFWIFTFDGNKYSLALQSSGIITKIDFDSKGLVQHYTFKDHCCMFPYQIRDKYWRNDSGNFENIVYKTITSHQPEKFITPRKHGLKKGVPEYRSPKEVLRSETSDEYEEIIPEMTEIEIIGEEGDFWFVKYKVSAGNSNEEFNLVFIPKQE